MAAPGGSRISRRPVPGTVQSASSIGFRIDVPFTAPPSADQRAIALLAQARSFGVTTFDVAPGTGSGRAERLIAAAFPTADPDLLVLVGRSLASLASDGTSDHPPSDGAFVERLRSSILDSTNRLHPQGVGLLEWRQDPDSSVRLREVIDALDRLRSEGAVGGWVLHVPPNGSLTGAAPDEIGKRVTLLSGAFSPLDRRLLFPISERASEGPTGFLARDPFGSGRLDGTRFAGSATHRRPDVRPDSVRELQREFDPVLRLGFLTEGRRRTLAQAALRFVLHWPWVCSCIVPIPSPERMDELTLTESTPPLSEGEVDRILALAS
ncbi:MAG: aldo/keto reductase [Thermoplasmata archaeon]